MALEHGLFNEYVKVSLYFKKVCFYMSFDVCVWFALMLVILENDENAMSVIFFVERRILKIVWNWLFLVCSEDLSKTSVF